MPFCRILCVLGCVYRMQYKNTLIVIYCSKLHIFLKHITLMVPGDVISSVAINIRQGLPMKP